MEQKAHVREFLQQFIVATPASYLAGHLAYNVFGKMLKRELEDSWRKYLECHNFSEVETPLMVSKETVEHSGHLEKFTDQIIKTKSGAEFRLDKLIEEETGQAFNSFNTEAIISLIESLNLTSQKEDIFRIPAPDGEGKVVWEEKNLMFLTNNGVALRPETAISTFSILNDLYHQGGYPIRIFQLGKAFRNEPNPKNLLLRMREFAQLEVQLIFDDKCLGVGPVDGVLQSPLSFPVLNEETGEIETLTTEELLGSGRLYESELIYLFQLLQGWIQEFLQQIPGAGPLKIRYVQHPHEELTFYAKDGWDLELYLDGFGWSEVAGIHNRGTHDLTQQSKYHNLCVEHPPKVYELAIGIDRLLYTLIDWYYLKFTKGTKDDHGKKLKTVFQLPPKLAPIKVAVLPLLKNKEALVVVAREVELQLRRYFRTVYLETGSVGNRYLRAGNQGIPYCVTIDFQTIETTDTDRTVTVRERDSEEQVRVPIVELVFHFFKIFS